jgi:hypothetical protein
MELEHPHLPEMVEKARQMTQAVVVVAFVHQRQATAHPHSSNSHLADTGV